MTAEPWSKWFWTDYEADPGLRMSSLAAQGLWMRMLCLMAKASPKGELRVGSEPCTMADLAVYVGQPEETVAALVEELERRAVFSRTRAGVIYNRRLRKDAELSKKRAKAGAKGAETTNLKFHNNSDLSRQNAGKGNGKSPAPEARSQKPDKSEDKPHSNGAGDLPDWVPREEWAGFKAMRVRIKKPLTQRAEKMALDDLARLRAEGQDPVAVLRQSEFHCWMGLFPVRGDDRNGAARADDNSLYSAIDRDYGRRAAAAPK